MKNWRPIKTAPKDELILLAQPPHNYGEYPWVVMQGRWINVHHTNFVQKCIGEGVDSTKIRATPYWGGCYDGIMKTYCHGLNDGAESHEARPLILYPSHWMPLPKPPKGRYKRSPIIE